MSIKGKSTESESKCVSVKDQPVLSWKKKFSNSSLFFWVVARIDANKSIKILYANLRSSPSSSLKDELSTKQLHLIRKKKKNSQKNSLTLVKIFV